MYLIERFQKRLYFKILRHLSAVQLKSAHFSLLACNNWTKFLIFDFTLIYVSHTLKRLIYLTDRVQNVRVFHIFEDFVSTKHAIKLFIETNIRTFLHIKTVFIHISNG